MTNKAKVDRPYSNHTSVKLISLQLCLSFGNIEIEFACMVICMYGFALKLIPLIMLLMRGLYMQIYNARVRV